ncbi:MAG: GGDEF domain-containing protein [Spirochaetota bacterium]
MLVSIYQFVLTFICAILFTLGVFYLARSIVIYRSIHKHFYFSLTTFGASMFVFFQLLLSMEMTQDTALLFHRLKMIGFFVMLSSGFACIYLIYFEKSKVPFVIFGLMAVLALSVPTDIFLSLPVEHITRSIGPVQFEYRLARTHIAYTLFAVLVSTSFLYSIVRVLILKAPFPRKVMGLLAFSPVIGGLNDFAVSHRLFTGIMVSEYFVFFYVIAIFLFFMKEDDDAYRTAKNMNELLRQEVDKQTKELRAANDRLQQAATTDLLTGLANRQELHRRLEEERSRVERYGDIVRSDFTIIFIDLDNFKYYNDTFGHHIGDVLLERFGELLKETVRVVDFCARFGGDEFIIIIFEKKPGEDAPGFLRRLHRQLAAKRHFTDVLSSLTSGTAIPEDKLLGFSAGIARYEKNMAVEALLSEADKALYAAKKSGKNICALHAGEEYRFVSLIG